MKVKAVFLIGLWLAFGSVGCNETEKKPDDAKQQEHDALKEQRVAKLANKTGAELNWKLDGDVTELYTYQLQAGLMPERNRPVVIRDLRIHDVTKENGVYIAQFRGIRVGVRGRGGRLDVFAEVSPEQLAQLAPQGSRRGFLREYAVAIQVTAVEKPRLRVTSASGEDGEIELRSGESVFVRGKCIDLVRLDD